MKNEVTAKRLINAMDRKGIKAQELADRSGVSKASISQYINGAHAPSNISAGKMADVLEVSPIWLMGFDVPMEEPKVQISGLDEEYYEDAEIRDIVDLLHKSPEYRILMSASKRLSKKDLELIIEMVERMS